MKVFLATKLSENEAEEGAFHLLGEADRSFAQVAATEAEEPKAMEAVLEWAMKDLAGEDPEEREYSGSSLFAFPSGPKPKEPTFTARDLKENPQKVEKAMAKYEQAMKKWEEECAPWTAVRRLERKEALTAEDLKVLWEGAQRASGPYGSGYLFLEVAAG